MALLLVAAGWIRIGSVFLKFRSVHNRFGGMRDLAIFRGDTWDAG